MKKRMAGKRRKRVRMKKNEKERERWKERGTMKGR